MSTTSTLFRKVAASFALVFALSCFSTAPAQSGRRTPKSTPKPVAAPTPEPLPSPATSAEKPKPLTRVIFGMDQPDSFSSVSLNATGGIRRSCIQRLEESGSVKVEVVSRAMLRSDAVNRAKAEKDGYVVWLRIREDTMGSSKTGTPNNVYIEYLLLAPTTAKVITSGGTYPQQRRGIVLDPRSTRVEGDYYLNRAARETADRILSKLRGRLP